MNETSVTLVGNLVDDPRLRTTETGVDVAGFRVASTARRWDRASGRWSDAGSLFLSVTCWRALAGNAVASLRKGDPVVVTGRLSTRTYEKDGQVRSACELEAIAIGPDLARGTAVFRRAPRPVGSGSDQPPGDAGAGSDQPPGDGGGGSGQSPGDAGGGSGQSPGDAGSTTPAPAEEVPALAGAAV